METIDFNEVIRDNIEVVGGLPRRRRATVRYHYKNVKYFTCGRNFHIIKSWS